LQDSGSPRKRKQRKGVAIEVAKALATKGEVSLTTYQMKPFTTSQDENFDEIMKNNFIARIERELGQPVNVTVWRREGSSYNVSRLLEAVIILAPQDT